MNPIFCFTAYGDEHINEYNVLVDSLLKMNDQIKVIVTTDDKERIDNRTYKVIELKETFNYNLKRVSIEEAFKETDTVIYLDTDIIFRNNIDFRFLDDLRHDYLYIEELFHLDHFRDRKGSLNYLGDYITTLSNIHPDLYLINEGMFILKTNRGLEFTRHWKEIDEQTRGVQKMNDQYYGAMEGFIMWISMVKSSIEPCIAKKGDNIWEFYRNMIHTGQDKQKYNKTLI
jgi:hypothetical protein